MCLVPPAVPHFQYTCFVDLESLLWHSAVKGGGASTSCGSPWSPDHSSPRAGNSNCSNHINLYKCTCWWQDRHTLFLVTCYSKTRTRAKHSQFYSCEAWFREGEIYSAIQLRCQLLGLYSVGYDLTFIKNWRYDTDRRKQSGRRKTVLSANFSTISPARTGLGLNQNVMRVRRLSESRHWLFLLCLARPKVFTNNGLKKCARERRVTELAKKHIIKTHANCNGQKNMLLITLTRFNLYVRIKGTGSKCWGKWEMYDTFK